MKKAIIVDLVFSTPYDLNIEEGRSSECQQSPFPPVISGTSGSVSVSVFDVDGDGVVDVAKSCQDVGDIGGLDPVTIFNSIYRG